MKILIGTLALNNIGITEGWLKSLYKNTYIDKDTQIDVLVVDNGSEEFIPGMVARVSKDAKFDTNIIKNAKNIGVAPGWNQILTFGTQKHPINYNNNYYPDFNYDYYVISNNDIWFGHNWLQPLIATMDENPRVGWASCLQNGCDELEETKLVHQLLGSFRPDPHSKPNYDMISAMMDSIYEQWGDFVQFCKNIQEKDKPKFHNGHSATCFMINPRMIQSLGYFTEFGAPTGTHEDHEYWLRMEKENIWEYRGVNNSIVHHHVCFTRKGPGFGDGHNYEVQRELNWRKMTGKKLFGIPGE